MKYRMTRRKFTKVVAAGSLSGSLVTELTPNLHATEGKTKPVRIGFIGVGGRGTRLLETILHFKEFQIPAICDVLGENLNKAQALVEKSRGTRPEGYAKGPHDYERLLVRDDLEAVVIATPWRWHIPMSIAAMRAGKYAACEVGPASSVEECWNLVKAREETGVPCMLLENGCYRREAMALLNMVRQGVLGELIQCQGGYLHDLRERIVTGKGTGVELPEGGDYRTRQNRMRNGDIYPTHGLGPLAQYLNINRGNRFVSIASFATKSRGLKAWTVENLGKNHRFADVDWAMGDLVTSVIQCQNGENVILQHDCALPRPRGFMRQVQGTKGIYCEEAGGIYIDGQTSGHRYEPFGPFQEKYEHPIWKDYLKMGIRGGHGGSDYLELRAFIDCLRNRQSVPIDAYDMATWMAVAPLSESSIAAGGEPVAFPDFTNGKWMARNPTG